MIDFKKVLKGFQFAFKGFRYLWSYENNFRFHLLTTMAVIAFSIYFRITAIEWLFVIIAIILVTGSEAFNTALEIMVDWKTKEPDPYAGKIKDIAAAAVTIFSIGALAIGIIIFYPYFRIFINSL